MHHHSAPYLPKANGAVEAANKNMKKILRKMIQGSRQWHEKLPFALLGYRTTVCISVGATPYLLVYGIETVIPIEVEIPSIQIIVESEIEDTEWVKTRLEQLMLIDEKRLAIALPYSTSDHLSFQFQFLIRRKKSFDHKIVGVSFDNVSSTQLLKIHLLKF
ncbi:uncharacterized protein [Nicotiana sylvestris]|uniref:uncharacterized protein n=1 Tax=Nicotiana sylvestris TaxID=4096 RepID=UPI00388C88EA